jgi:hypothetical protein
MLSGARGKTIDQSWGQPGVQEFLMLQPIVVFGCFVETIGDHVLSDVIMFFWNSNPPKERDRAGVSSRKSSGLMDWYQGKEKPLKSCLTIGKYLANRQCVLLSHCPVCAPGVYPIMMPSSKWL